MAGQYRPQAARRAIGVVSPILSTECELVHICSSDSRAS